MFYTLKVPVHTFKRAPGWKRRKKLACSKKKKITIKKTCCIDKVTWDEPKLKFNILNYKKHLDAHKSLLVRLCRYQHAVANPGLITFTGPYLDVAGAGYVVTISHTIHASRYEIKKSCSPIRTTQNVH